MSISSQVHYQSKPLLQLYTFNVEKGCGGKPAIDFIVEKLRRKNDNVIFCLQEATSEILQEIQKRTNCYTYFEPMCHYKGEYKGKLYDSMQMLATCSNLRLSSHPYYYNRISDEVPIQIEGMEANCNNLALRTDCTIRGETFSVINMHHRWSADGKSDEKQIECTDKLLGYLGGITSDLILIGDGNFPREDPHNPGSKNIVYKMISTQLQDCVPQYIKSTINPELHRNPQIRPMVIDHIFTKGDSFDKGRLKIRKVSFGGAFTDHQIGKLVMDIC